MRQCCLAHLIRKAKGLAERKDPGMARCGKWARDESPQSKTYGFFIQGTDLHRYPTR